MKFTKEEELYIIEFYEENQNILEGSGANAAIKKRDAWNTCARVLNSKNPAGKKNGEECRKKWHNLKAKAKSQNAERKRSASKTGGGPPSVSHFVETDEKIISILGNTPSFNGVEGGIESGIAQTQPAHESDENVNSFLEVS